MGPAYAENLYARNNDRLTKTLPADHVLDPGTTVYASVALSRIEIIDLAAPRALVGAIISSWDGYDQHGDVFTRQVDGNVANEVFENCRSVTFFMATANASGTASITLWTL